MGRFRFFRVVGVVVVVGLFQKANQDRRRCFFSYHDGSRGSGGGLASKRVRRFGRATAQPESSATMRRAARRAARARRRRKGGSSPVLAKLAAGSAGTELCMLVWSPSLIRGGCTPEKARGLRPIMGWTPTQRHYRTRAPPLVRSPWSTHRRCRWCRVLSGSWTHFLEVPGPPGPTACPRPIDRAWPRS